VVSTSGSFERKDIPPIHATIGIVTGCADKVDETVARGSKTARGDAVETALSGWMAALEARHLADLRLQEVTRALRALSAVYVERRHDRSSDESRQKVRGSLDSAGKRAAFALFYGPLHFIAVARVVLALGATRPGPRSIIDLGCGTGAAGAAWACLSSTRPPVLGIDHHPWAAEEARWSYAHFGLSGRTRVGDITRIPPLGAGDAIVAAYVLNELAERVRLRVEESLIAAASRGVRVLVLEPIARAVTPWWDETAERIVAQGGRADEWRFPIERPPMVALLDKAAGLDHRELTLRTLFI
jgi:SAM-dependent methyltransferase